MPFQIRSLPLLKVQRMVWLGLPLWWELRTNFPYHRSWRMNVIRRITSKTSDSDNSEHSCTITYVIKISCLNVPKDDNMLIRKICKYKYFYPWWIQMYSELILFFYKTRKKIITRDLRATARSTEWNSHCRYIFVFNSVIATNERIII